MEGFAEYLRAKEELLKQYEQREQESVEMEESSETAAPVSQEVEHNSDERMPDGEPASEPEQTEQPETMMERIRTEPVGEDKSKKRACTGTIHVVKQGDTLYKIAQMHELKVVDLLLANPYVNIYNLQVGSELCIPVKKVPPQEGRVPYIVRKGDTIGKVLDKNQITFEELVRENPFLADLALTPNTVIFIRK